MDFDEIAEHMAAAEYFEERERRRWKALGGK